MKRASIALVAVAVALAACASQPSTPDVPAAEPSAPPAAPPAAAFDALERNELNRLAAELALPLFWASDDDGDGAVDPDELAVLWGIADTPRSHWVGAEGLTLAFAEAYQKMIAHREAGRSYAGLDEKEAERRKLIERELDQGRPTLIRTRLARDASAEDRAIVDNVLAAAAIIERLHLKQIGSFELKPQLPADHAASRMVFYRNQGPWCVAPETEGDPRCNAIPSQPPRVSGLYPAKLQQDENFCEALKKHPDAEKLRHQFHVVREMDGKLTAVPYHQAYAEEVKAVSERLTAAAAAITSEGEQPLKKYLLAAAQAFLDDNWEPADEAWAAMNVHNSKWYLRIGPDEVYFEPCSLKAGYHVSFARINQDSLSWQKKLDPVKNDMEKALAELAGPPYKAREVSFHLPDFIDIVLNAGDSRSPHGATIGQSLPNWGKVANEGRGRTVAMTNLYTDPDSLATRKEQAASLFCPASMNAFRAEPEWVTMGTVLHEAAHNLGPSHEYKVKGKKATEVFGGPLASTLEELKAQTAALFFTDWLLERKLVTAEQAERTHLANVAWSFGHISRGMYSPTGQPKPYSQLAAIQVGYLLEHGALRWNADAKAANGTDTGCIERVAEAFPKAARALMKEVAGIKGRGDKAAADALIKKYVDVSGEQKKLLDTIRERWLRAPKASFVYAIEG